MKSKQITLDTVKKVAKLANLPISQKQANELTKQLGVTVTYVSQLQALPTENVTETAQVTGLTNVWREDVVDKTRMLSQKEALANARRKHNGFFVVDAIFEE